MFRSVPFLSMCLGVVYILGLDFFFQICPSTTKLVCYVHVFSRTFENPKRSQFQVTFLHWECI